MSKTKEIEKRKKADWFKAMEIKDHWSKEG